MKVICAGYGKTGTKSMREAFEILGYKNVHDSLEQIMYDFDIIEKVFIEGNATSEDIREAYIDVDATTDAPVFFYWDKLMEVFPEAKIVLTVRDDSEVWYKSFENMVNILRRDNPRILRLLMWNRFCPNILKSSVIWKKTYNLVTGLDLYQCDKNEAIRRYEKHNKTVIDACPPQKLLVFNVKDGWKPLCEFLGKDIPTDDFPRRNVGHELSREIRTKSMKYDGGFVSHAHKELQRILILICSSLITFISILVYAIFW